MSYNRLQNFDEDAFDDCCENLTVLDLSNNDISSLTRRHFERLKNLKVLFLSSNKINSLPSDIFVNLTELKRLDLSGNPLELDALKTEGFLVSTSLEELNLDDCNISELPEAMFNNMTQLRNLTLSGNAFDDVIDTSAFAPLQNLLKLQINDVSRTSVYMLCEKLAGIDVINFDTFNLSCLILSGDDESFEESVVLNDVAEPKMGLVKHSITTTRKAIVTDSITSSTSHPLKYVPSTEMSTTLPPPQLIETTETDQTFTNSSIIEARPPGAIDIDNETIKYILLGESKKKLIKLT